MSMKHFRKGFGIRLLLILSLLGALTGITFAHTDHVDHTDEEIDAMDIDSLVHVEHDLRSQNGLVDKHIASLRGKLVNSQKQQEALQSSERKVSHARDWESRQKRVRQKELERARAELEAKKEQTQTLLSEAHKLREEIRELKDALRALNLDKMKLDNQYLHPSFGAILIHKAARMGLVPQRILDLTIKHIVPEVEHKFHEVLAVQENMPNDSTVITVLTSLCVYVLALSVLYITWTLLRNFKNLFTMTRILFTVDMAFACAWMFACFIYLLLSADPFDIMAKRHGGLTVIVQVVLIGSLIGNILLRCTLLSIHFKKIPFIELLCAIFVTQHYYQSVWRPCLLDEELNTTFGTYFMYFLISVGLAVYRARCFGRGMEEVEGFYNKGSRGFLQRGTWIRLKMEQAFRYCEKMFSKQSRQSGLSYPVEPQYYRKTRHPEFSRGKGRSIFGRSSLRYGKKPVGYKE